MENPADDFGVIYSATGQKFVDEAVRSARSLKQVMPDLPVTLYTDLTEVPDGVFDVIEIIEHPHYSTRDKIQPLCDPPYQRTLYIDTDTYIAEPFYEVFDALQRFDIIFTHAPGRYRTKFEEIPDCFTEPNGGLIGVNRNQRALKAMDSWKLEYERQLEATPNNKSDQGVLRKAIYQSDASIYVMPPEYNFRCEMPAFLGARLKAKILHGRKGNLASIAEIANSSEKRRIVMPGVLLPLRNELLVSRKPWHILAKIHTRLSHMIKRLTQ